MPERRRLAQSIDVNQINDDNDYEFKKDLLSVKARKPNRAHLNSQAKIKRFEEILNNFEQVQKEKVERIRQRNNFKKVEVKTSRNQ